MQTTMEFSTEGKGLNVAGDICTINKSIMGLEESKKSSK